MQAVDVIGILGYADICIYRHLALTGKFLTNVKNNPEQYFQANTDVLFGETQQ